MRFALSEGVLINAFVSFVPFFFSPLFPWLRFSYHPNSGEKTKNEGVHLDPHRSGRDSGRQCLLGTLLPRARHPGNHLISSSSFIASDVFFCVFSLLKFVRFGDVWEVDPLRSTFWTGGDSRNLSRPILQTIDSIQCMVQIWTVWSDPYPAKINVYVASIV